MNIIKIIETTKKIQTIKNNENKGNSNILLSTCGISGNYINRGNAICLNVKNNNTTYVSKEYLTHSIFENLKLSQSFKIDILTLVYLGAIAINTNNNTHLKKYNSIYNKNDTATYIINFKNGIQIKIYDNDASSKKFFNILKNYKSSISNISFHTYLSLSYINHEYYSCEYSTYVNIKVWGVYYPPYIKKLFEYHFGIGYNPDTKKTTIKFW